MTLEFVSVSLGALAAGAVAVLVLVRRRPLLLQAAFLLVLMADVVILSATVPHTIVDVSVIAAAALVAAGAMFAALNRSRIRGVEEEDLTLSEGRVRAPKGADDLFVLVVGPEGSGKSTFVRSAVAEAEAHPIKGLQLAARARTWEGPHARLTEVPMFLGDRPRTLRLWELETIPGDRGGDLPRFEDLDAVVLVVDPTQHAPLAPDFPETFRRSGFEYDANDLVLSVVGAVGRSGHEPAVWAVMTKVDLLRFAVTPALLRFPIEAGPGWSLHGCSRR